MATYGFCKQIFQRSFSRLRGSLFNKSIHPSLKPKPRRVLRTAPPVAAIPVLSALALFTTKTDESARDAAAAANPAQMIIEEADRLYDEGKFDELYEYLKQYKNTGDANILWRIGRSMHDKAKEEKDRSTKKLLIESAFAMIQKALANDDNNFAVHKWMGIMLQATSAYGSAKEMIAKTFKIQEHFKKAVELNPEDATSRYLLGCWCYEVANIGWMQYKVACMMFATPPTSTYEEALDYFLDAEKVEPNFYNQNLLMLGKTYLKLNKNAEAKDYFQRAVVYPVKSQEDKDVHEEAEMNLKSM